MIKMKREEILLLLTIGFVLTFCGTVTAHPGHITYPDEIIINESTPTPDQSASTGTNNGGSVSKSSSVSGDKSAQTKTSNNKATDNNVEGQPVEEVSTSTGVSNGANVNSEGSNSFPWSTAAVVGGLVGLVAVGIFFKWGLRRQ